jgi:hypothetical protein
VKPLEDLIKIERLKTNNNESIKKEFKLSPKSLSKTTNKKSSNINDDRKRKNINFNFSTSIENKKKMIKNNNNFDNTKIKNEKLSLNDYDDDDDDDDDFEDAYQSTSLTPEIADDDTNMDNTIIENNNISKTTGEISKNLHKYINMVNDNEKGIDLTYGVRKDNNNYFIGNQEVSFNDQYISLQNGKKYAMTSGLLDLLFLHNPIEYNPSDFENYGEIIRSTNVHRINYDENQRIKGNSGIKYNKIIKPLTKDREKNTANSPNQNRGGNFSPFPLMKYSNKPREYIYFNDVNEIIERLKLLIASTKAGNTNHMNEINSILEELKEDGIIA